MNINLNAAYLHVLGDMIMSVGVIIAASIIYLDSSLWWMDPCCTYFFSLIVIFTTVPIIKSCVGVMMEGAPRRIDIDQLKKDIKEAGGDDIVEVHDLHVWTLSMDKISMSVHIVSVKPLKTLSRVTDMCRRKH